MTTKRDAPRKHRSTVLTSETPRSRYFVVVLPSAALSNHFLGGLGHGHRFPSARLDSAGQGLVIAVFVATQILVDAPAWVLAFTNGPNQLFLDYRQLKWVSVMLP